VRIAAQSATFAESFVKLGIIPGDGGAFLLQRIVGQSQAVIMTFTGEAIDTTRALACGLVSQVVPHEQLLPTAMALAAKIAANPGDALRMAERLMRESVHSQLDTVLELSAAFQVLAHSSADHREKLLQAVAAMTQKR
jgi:enoyl-CoA hydratase/carnithine racemase